MYISHLVLNDRRKKWTNFRNCYASYFRNNSKIEVCMGLTLPMAQHSLRAGLASINNVQAPTGFSPGSQDWNQMLYRTFWGLSGYSFFTKKKLFIVMLILCSCSGQSGSGNKSWLDFHRDFCSCPLPETVWGYNL